MSFTFLNELPSPAQIQERYPLSEKLQELKKQRDARNLLRIAEALNIDAGRLLNQKHLKK